MREERGMGLYNGLLILRAWVYGLTMHPRALIL